MNDPQIQQRLDRIERIENFLSCLCWELLYTNQTLADLSAVEDKAKALTDIQQRIQRLEITCRRLAQKQ